MEDNKLIQLQKRVDKLEVKLDVLIVIIKKYIENKNKEVQYINIFK